jgi:hypothetical protein
MFELALAAIFGAAIGCIVTGLAAANDTDCDHCPIKQEALKHEKDE